MSSERRIQSSRANGARSHGAVTPAGRLKSAYNNLRHGILAETVVLEDENSETFNEILAALTREFDPQTEAQLGLVETMASARWRLMRIWSVERQTLKSEIGKHDPAKHDPAARAALAFHDLANNSRTLDVINRYESRYDRQYSRSLNLLLKLARPDNPLTQICQTNLVPQTDTPSGPRGAGLPAGASAECADQSPVEPAPTEAAPPIANSHTPGPATAAPFPPPNPLRRCPKSSQTRLPPRPQSIRCPKLSHTISKKFAATY